MDVSRLKKVLAGFSVAAITLTQVGTALAYYDVPSGVWYEEAVNAFRDAGYLDASQANFRGTAPANRAEFTKLIVELNGGILSTPPAVASFDDVKASAWYYGYMEEAGKEGWVRGDKDCYGSHPCYARPGANINRAEAAALITRAFSLEATGAAPQFVDNPTGMWYTSSIQTAADHCVLQGDDATGRVRPSDNMNRAEMVVMLHRVDQGLTYGVDCGGGQPGQSSGISSANAVAIRMIDVDFNTNVDQITAENPANYTVTSGTQSVAVTAAKLTGAHTVELTLAGDLDPSLTYTVTVSGVMDAMNMSFSDSAQFKGYSSLPVGNGTLEVSLSSKNPMGDAVPKGAIGVAMLGVDLTASCDDSVSLSDLTVLHEGFGASADIDGVYATVNGARVSRKRTLDSKDQTATLHFSTPLEIPACKTVTLDLVADISTTAVASAEHTLVVELPSDVMSNAKAVTGNFPMKGNTFRIAAVTAGTITISYRTVSPSTVKVGDKAALIGKFEVATSSTEDITLYSMTMQQNSTVHDNDLQNLKIARSDGTVLTNTVATTNGDYATFVFNPPFIVKQSDKITLNVISDIVGGANESVQMIFEEASDIFGVGSLYGYGVNGQLYGSQVSLPTSANATTVTIDAGQFTISIDGPAQQTYTRDQTDALLANVNLSTGGDPIDVRHLFVVVQGNNSTGGTLASSNTTSFNEISEVISSVTLKDTKTGRSIDGIRLTGVTDSGQATSGLNSATTTGTFQIYRFDDFTVTGEAKYQFLVDLIDNGAGNSPKSGDQFKIQICGEPTQVSTGTNTTKCTFGGLLPSGGSTSYQMTVEGLSTGDTVNDVRPRGTVTGNAMRIATASLVISVKSTGTSDTAVKNSKNVNLFRFEARAGEAKDVLLTKATVTSQSGSLNNAQNYTLWVDTDGNGVVDTIVDAGETAQGGNVTFSKLTGGGFVIAKEKTVVFEVHGDIAASLTNNWIQLQFGTTATAVASYTAYTGTLGTYLEAEDVVRGSSLSGIKTDGACDSTTCDITVTRATAKFYQLVSQGSLFVSNDSVPVTNHQCLGGVVCDPVLRLNMHAENESIDVTDLQLTSSGGTAGSVDHLDLFVDGNATPFATATVGGCGSDLVRSYYGASVSNTAATFCAKMQSQQLVIPKGGDVKVLVKPSLKTDVNGAISNDPIQFFVDNTQVSNNATGSGAVRARGVASSNNLSANNGNPTADGEIFIGVTTATANVLIKGVKSVSVLAKISGITNINPDANGTQVPVGVANVGQFRISAAPNSNSKNGLNKVVLSGVIFNVNATNVAIASGSFVIFNKVNSTVTQTCNAQTTGGTSMPNVLSGSFIVTCRNLPTGSVNTTIDQGTSADFVLQANITNPKVTASNSSQLQVSIQAFASITNTTFGPASSHFQWLDQDTTTTKFNWVEFTDTTVKSTSYQS